MWNQLPDNQKHKYKLLILGYASLTPAFAQKNDEEKILTPIINSKYQETSFKDAFNATIEDIGNTSYDASVRTNINGSEKKYLVGIKTFGYFANEQKVAQYKAYLKEWSEVISEISKNSKECKTTEEVNEANRELYEQLAVKISKLRNRKIESSKANLRGFELKQDDDIESVYHVLMPYVTDEGQPTVVVGEMSYDEINISKLQILGCTGKNNPTNFRFTDGNHEYKFTAADSQLYMNFHNNQIQQDSWNVKYLDNADQIFLKIAEQLYEKGNTYGLDLGILEGNLDKFAKPQISESYSWLLTDKEGKVPRYSGFNSFYGLGNKQSPKARIQRVKNFPKKYYGAVSNDNELDLLISKMIAYIENPAKTDAEKPDKEIERNELLKLAMELNNEDLLKEVTTLLYRPRQEVYIPIPNAKVFHEQHPNFFGKNAAELKENGRSLAKDVSERSFNLIFEPSGQQMRAFIAEDTGKSIESLDSQAIMGKWLIEGVFQLEPYQPLTTERLNELDINGIRLFKLTGSNDVHLEFIWIDKSNVPDDFIEKNR